MIFLTGATGFLGRQLLGRLLVYEPREQFAVLVRSDKRQSAELRLQETLAEVFAGCPNSAERIRAANERIRVVPGDISLDNFGLSAFDFKDLAAQVSTIYHAAAITSLASTLQEARRINVGGTSQVTKLGKLAATNSDFSRLHYVSTAFVAGDQHGTISPESLNLSVRFRNGYEQSKAEAETLVRGCAADVPFTIYRPSIIVGDSVTGETSAFNVLYTPARLLANGLLKAVPGIPDIPFDVVPINYVVDAIVALSRNEVQQNTCYHLCAGVGRESSPLEVRKYILRAVNQHQRAQKRVSVPPFVAPEVLSRCLSPHTAIHAAREGMKQLEDLITRNLLVLRQLIPFLPYLIANPRFDTGPTNKRLANVLPQAPLFKHYADVLFGYCMDTNWGRLPWHNPHYLVTWLNRLHPFFN